MAQTVSLNGRNYSLPTSNDVDWGASVASWMRDITRAVDASDGQASVLDYGARGDGVTDDTAAIAAAVAAANAGNLELVFPPGVYIMSDEVAITRGVTISGLDGVAYGGASRIIQTGAGKAVFRINGTLGVNTEHIKIRNLWLSGSQTLNQYTAGSYGIRLEGARPVSGTATVYRVRFEWCYFTGFERAISAVATNAAIDWQVDNIVVDHCTFAENLNGIWAESFNCDYWKLDSCTFGTIQGGHGLHVHKGGNFVLLNCYGVTNHASDTFVYVDSSVENIDFIHCQAEPTGTFLDYTTDAPNDLDHTFNFFGCIMDTPIHIRKNFQAVFIGCRMNANVYGDGDDVRFYSIGCTFTGSYDFQLSVNSKVIFNSTPQSGTSVVGGLYSDSLKSKTSTSLTLVGSVISAAIDAGLKFGNANSITGSSGKIASFYSDNLVTEQAYLDKDGVFTGTGFLPRFGLTYALGAASKVWDLFGRFIKDDASNLRIEINTTVANGGAGNNLYHSYVADGASAVAHTFKVPNGLANATSKLFSIFNGATEKIAIDKDGVITGQGLVPQLSQTYALGTAAKIWDMYCRFLKDEASNTRIEVNVISGSNGSNAYNSAVAAGETTVAAHIFNTVNILTGATGKLCAWKNGSAERISINKSGRIDLDASDSSGTPGSATINKPSGKFAVASGASSATITNSTVGPGSIVHPVMQTADGTNFIKSCVVSSGSFVVTMNAATGTDVTIGFTVHNA